MTLSIAAFNQINSLRGTFGDGAITDMLRLINASPQFQLQVNNFVERTGTITVGNLDKALAQYSPVDAGTITFAAPGPNVNYVSGNAHSWQIGYGMAEALAHELGHAFDPRLLPDALAAARANGIEYEVILRTQSEANAELNSLRLLSEARQNLRSDSVNDPTPLPFTPYSNITSFAGGENLIRGLFTGVNETELAATCSSNGACLALLTDWMGRGGDYGGNYYQSIMKKLAGEGAIFVMPAQLKLGEDGGFDLVAADDGLNTLNVVDHATGVVVQRLRFQGFDDGSGLVTLTAADGSLIQTTSYPGGLTVSDANAQHGGLTVSAEVGDSDVTFTAARNGENEIILQGIATIDGEPPLSSLQDLVNEGISSLELTPEKAFENLGNLAPFVAAADPANPTGVAPPVPGGSNWQNPQNQQNPQTVQNMAVLSDVQSLISALRAGRPLPIATSLFNLGAHISKDPVLAQIATGLGVAGGIASLADALKRGDYGQAVLSAGGVVKSSLQIYTTGLKEQIALVEQSGDVASAALQTEFNNASAALEMLGTVLSVVNIIYSITHGDIRGAVVATIALAEALASTGTYYGLIAGGVLMLLDGFLSNSDYGAKGRYIVQADGNLAVQIYEDDHGAGSALTDIMNQLLEVTREQARLQGVASGQTLALIAQRLPEIRTVGYTDTGTLVINMYWKDAETGITYARTFDAQGHFLKSGTASGVHGGIEGELNPEEAAFVDHPANSPDFFKSLAQQFGEAAIKSGAIAPKWFADTVTAQTHNGVEIPIYESYLDDDNNQQQRIVGYTHEGAPRDPQAGMTSAQRAAADGMLLAQDPGDSAAVYGGAYAHQTFHPIVMDLNHFYYDSDNLVTSVDDGGRGVMFDVDNDGYAEMTDWIGPRQGFLVMDRDGDGEISGGHDLFSDSRVDTSYSKAPSVLKELDANLDGKITDVDPAFAHMQVWQDIDQDGVVDEHELHSLTEMGITDLQYGGSYYNDNSQWMIASVYGGAFTMNGQMKAMETTRLDANAQGQVTTTVGNSLLVAPEGQSPYLMAQAAYDYSKLPNASDRAPHIHTSAGGEITATDELVDGYEDTPITISVAQLLNNDKGSGALEILSVAGAQNGTVEYLGYNQTITFRPTANFTGLASFTYTVKDEQSNQVTSTAFIDVGGVDDAPVAALVQPTRQVYWSDMQFYGAPDGSGEVSYWTLPGNAELRPAAGSLSIDPSGITSPMNGQANAIGMSGGKIYFAALPPGIPTVNQIPVNLQLQWQEVWMPTWGGGGISASDVDTAGPIGITVPKEGSTYFGEFKASNNAEGPITYTYRRTYFEQVGWTDEASHYVPGVAGPDDAVLVNLTQTIAGQKVVTTQKIVLPAGNASSNEDAVPDQMVTPNTEGNGGARSVAPTMPANFSGIASHGWTLGTDGKWAFDADLDAQENRWISSQQNWLGPVVLDLNGNGIVVRSTDESTAFFDSASDGQRHLTAWVSGRDAVLAFDANGDHHIAGKNEISFAGYLAGAETDLQGLAYFDTNNDGKLSAADAQWGSFYLWQDRNEDGVQQDGELYKPGSIGVVSIGLESDEIARSVDGAIVHGFASYTLVDGTQGDVADISLAYTDEVYVANPDDDVTLAATGEALDTGVGDDRIQGGAGNDTVSAGAGDDRIDGAGGADFLDGGAGADVIMGGDGNDVIIGGSGRDRLFGGDGDDELDGGTGEDQLNGGAGQDDYLFRLGDGQDIVVDVGATGEITRILLGEGIAPSDVEGYHSPGLRTLWYSEDDSINLAGLSATNGNMQVVFADGTVWNTAQILAATNNAPTVQQPVADRIIKQGNALSTVLPAGTFADADGGDALTMSVRLANGDPLPSWLHFDSETLKLSGTPGAPDLGALNLRFTATDVEGATTSSTFNLTVISGNNAPTVATQIQNQGATEDAIWSYVVPTSTFADVDAGDTLTYSATKADGTALPSWLTFNATTRTFSGTPLNANVGALSLKVVVTDAAGATANSTFTVTVANINDAPTLATALTSQNATEDAAWNFVVPSGTFADVDAGDTLTYSATKADGTALPSWLTFNASTRTFSGTPLNANVGALSVKVTASDTVGASVNATFTVNVANTNDAPTVAVALDDQSAVEGSAWNFVVPAETFADVDTGDALAYSATRADGAALPAWLSFNATTRTFSGTPPIGLREDLAIRVSAQDSQGANVQSVFALAIAPTNTDSVAVGGAPSGSTNSTALGYWTGPSPGVTPLAGVSHRSDATSATEAWSALSATDVYNANVGVAGQSAMTSTIPAELDGKEVLRLDLARPATSATLNFAQLQSNETSSGYYEAGLIRMYDANRHLIGESAFQAEASSGTKTITVAATTAFSSLEIVAGAYTSDSSVIVGHAPVVQTTPGQWAAAWTTAGVAISHKANAANASEAWSSVTPSGLSPQTLAGGDIFQGDIGVSGQSIASSSVRQELDGSEVLRFDLTQAATQMTLGLSRFYANDDGGALVESGRIRLLDSNGNVVGGTAFRADSATGTKLLTLASNTAFTAVEINAGAYDESGFVYGGYAAASGAFGAAPGSDANGTHGSDFLVDFVKFGSLATGGPGDPVFSYGAYVNSAGQFATAITTDSSGAHGSDLLLQSAQFDLVPVTHAPDTTALKIGDAPDRQFAAGGQWATAWTKPGISISHKADATSATEVWSAATPTGLSPQTLGGGDIYVGDIGVSGQSALTSTVRQEIDGKEALRFDVADGATGVHFRLTRLNMNDDGLAYSESGRIVLRDAGGNIVGEQAFVANSGSGTSSVISVISPVEFASVEFNAGAYDGSTFVYGAYVNADGTFASGGASATHGSDFQVDWIEFDVVQNQNMSMSPSKNALGMFKSADSTANEFTDVLAAGAEGYSYPMSLINDLGDLNGLREFDHGLKRIDVAYEQLGTSDGKSLLSGQVHNLVDAMAAFSPPAPGQTTVSTTYASPLGSIMATNWQ